MANARALDKRRKSIRNIRKITRTMELIATARFKRAMDRALAATAYTNRITRLVTDLAESGLEVSHPLLESRDHPQHAILLVLSSNRGLCGGYNGSVLRLAAQRHAQLQEEIEDVQLEVSGKRGISAMHYRHITVDQRFTNFEHRPKFKEVERLANRYLDAYAAEKLDRLDIAYTRFVTSAKQTATVETLLPLESPEGPEVEIGRLDEPSGTAELSYEFLPSAQSILQEIVPTSFKVKLFKCFLDAAVSEQIARMVAMKSATENADEIIKYLSMTYNRARQSQITNEIMEVIGGAEALNS